MALEIQLKCGTAASATANNKTLAQGEIGIETDTLKLKIGDGVTAWNSLAYYSTTGGTEWLDTRTYNEDEIVGYSGALYISLQDANLNKQPDTQTLWWEEFESSSPLTTKGDLLGYSTLDARLPVGTNDQVLTADSTETLGVKWADAGGGGTSDTPQTLTFAATMTPVLAGGNIITVTMTNDGTMNVPSDMTAGQLFQFRKIQDASGGNILTWAAGFKFNGGVTPVQTGTALSIDEFTFRAISATEASFQYIGYDA